MAETNCWKLIERHCFAAACRTAERAAKNGRPFDLRNKVIALLNLGQFREAIKLCSKMAEAHPEGIGSDLIMAGVALWLMDKPMDAIDLWRQERKAKYADAAGGMTAPLLLHFAAVSLADHKLMNEATARIKKLLGNTSAFNWPGPVGSYVLGLSSVGEMMARLSHQPILRDRQLCVANFHIGVNCFHTDPAQSTKHMALALKGCPAMMLEPHYYLAKGHLVRQRLAKWAKAT